MEKNRQFFKLGKPIVNIESDNYNYEARCLNPDALYGLKNSLFLEKGQRLLWKEKNSLGKVVPMSLLD